MTTELIIELPEFDTGQYEDCEFVMSAGAACSSLGVEIVHLLRAGDVISEIRDLLCGNRGHHVGHAGIIAGAGIALVLGKGLGKGLGKVILAVVSSRGPT